MARSRNGDVVVRRPLGRAARLWVLTGIPGAGKSTYAREHLVGCVRVSLDDLRVMMSGRDYDPDYEPMVSEMARAGLDALLARANAWGFDVVFDATNVTRDWRRDAIARARRHGVEPYAVFIDVPFEVAVERNAARGRVVPDDVMRRFQNHLEPPSVEEGFVEVVRVAE